MADKLAIYRGALRLLGPSELASLTESRPERFKLDAAWTPAVEYLLAKGMWNFAIRTVEIDADPVPPALGFEHTFTKPTDWVRTVAISDTPQFLEGIRRYEDQATKWYTDYDPIYVRYVSNGASYGLNIAAWRQPFAKALEAYLAFECGLPISADRGNRNDLYTLFEQLLADAKSLDAVDERVRFKPPGRWTRSRNYYGTRDRNRG